MSMVSSFREVEKIKIHFQPHETREQVAHFMPLEKVEIFKSLEEWVEKNVLIHIKPVEKSWQPEDFLPDPSSEGFIDQIIELREQSHEFPDDYLVCLVGHMITEEALPTYQTMMNTCDGERATFISHANTASFAKGYGDLKLAQICRTIVADKKRHETAYTKIVEKLFETDADTTMLAFEDMMQKKVVMPAHLTYDGQDVNLFNHSSSVAQRLGVYTARDYADILEFLVERWNVNKISGLSGKGREAKDYVCNLAPHIRKLNGGAKAREK